jgi:heterodisulfide reductase subunit A-like polyferredoxin
MKNCRIGVYICMCGTNIAKIVDVEAVAKYVSGIPDVVLARHINICVPIPDRR